jgi:predicted  nucleic acid-binding Zn-ribbon protein
LGPELETLFKLQEIDVRLLEKQRSIDVFEARVAARRKAMQEVRARIDAMVAKRKQMVTERALAERRVSDSGELVKERRQRISRVRNEKELHALEGEIAAMREEIGEQEEQLLAVMGRVEDIERQIGVAEKEYLELEQADHRDLAAEQARVDELKAELANARAGRDAVAAGLDARLRSRYETVFKRRQGVAVVTIIKGTCSGCHMYVPPQTINEILKSGTVHVCPSCQRILYVSEAV